MKKIALTSIVHRPIFLFYPPSFSRALSGTCLRAGKCSMMSAARGTTGRTGFIATGTSIGAFLEHMIICTCTRKTGSNLPMYMLFCFPFPLHCTESSRENISDRIRTTMEHCDSLQSFLMLHSLGGGTGDDQVYLHAHFCPQTISASIHLNHHSILNHSNNTTPNHM